MRDNLMTESEPAQALREIRSRYPEFDMVHFVRALKLDVPVVIKAYLEGDLEALKEHSSPQMMERFTGIINAQKAEVSLEWSLCSVSTGTVVQHVACKVWEKLP